MCYLNHSVITIYELIYSQVYLWIHRAGGAANWKWDMGMCGPENPLFTPSWPFTRLPFQHFSTLNTLLSSPNHKFLEILTSKALKLANEYSSKASREAKIQLTWLHHKGLKFGSGPFANPFVPPFWPHMIAKWKLSNPRARATSAVTDISWTNGAPNCLY